MKTSRSCMQKVIAIALLTYLFVNGASAAKVGVVASFPGGATRTECVTVAAGTDAYQIIQRTGLNAAWSSFPSFGHGLCGIDGTGCPASNCFCSMTEYWGFYEKASGAREWTYSATGFDGGSTCSDHYCATDGAMIGLGYGAYGTTPADYSFDEVCADGDANGDGSVDYDDLVLLASSYGKETGESGFDERADYDGDGAVGYADLMTLAANYGK